MSETKAQQVTSFGDEALDKTIRVLEFLDVFKNAPGAKGKVCLHGGTALNLFALTPERLSLDADVNYIGEPCKDDIYEDRLALERAVSETARELGYEPRAGKEAHAGRTFKLMYNSEIIGSRDFLKVDLNFMNRVPLLDPVMAKATTDVFPATFPINAPVEIVAGKLKAICERVVPRDLFDIGRIAKIRPAWSSGDDELDHSILMFYFSLSASFPKNLDILARFKGRDKDVEEILWSVLPVGQRPSLATLIDAASPFIQWATTPQNDDEREYLQQLALGNYNPELLFSSHENILSNAQASPAMRWKVMNLEKGIEAGIISAD